MLLQHFHKNPGRKGVDSLDGIDEAQGPILAFSKNAATAKQPGAASGSDAGCGCSTGRVTIPISASCTPTCVGAGPFVSEIFGRDGLDLIGHLELP